MSCLLADDQSINRFVTYLLSEGLFEAPIGTPFYQPLLDDYLAWMRRERSATPGTCELRTHSLVTFVRWLGPRATPRGLAQLNAEEVERTIYARSIVRTMYGC